MKALEGRHELWVITWHVHRAGIEAELSQRPLAGVRFLYYDLPGCSNLFQQGGMGTQVYYYLWQIGAGLAARRLHRRFRFDVAHHVTYATGWQPALVGLLPVPFVWGPVGGAETAPSSFAPGFTWKGRAYETLRSLVRRKAVIDPLVRLTAKRAGVALATTEESAAFLRRLGARNVDVCTQVALPDDEFHRLAQTPPPCSPAVRFLSLGRFIHWKGFHLSIEAFARAVGRLPDAEYWLVGEGPERERLERVAADLGVADKVRFYGWVPRDLAFGFFAEADVLVHPSLHDSGGYVCIEAMAAGRPVLCLDLGGPAVVVDVDSGIKVPAPSPAEAIDGLAEAMVVLGRDADLRCRLGEAGRRRVREQFLWSGRSRWMEQVYADLIQGAPRDSRTVAGPEGGRL